MVANVEIARVLEEMSDLLELQAANPFRIRAYRTAARVIGELAEPVSERLKDPARPLTDLPGIGKDLAEKIADLARTGKFPALREAQRQTPKGLREIMGVPGLGPKRAVILYQKLGVRSKEGLREAALKHRIRSVPGFGEKTEAQILSGIEHLTETSQRFHVSEARAYAAAMEAHLRRVKGRLEVTAAGSLRRWKDTIGDLDFVVCCEDGEKMMEQLARFSGIASVLGRGPTKMSVRLNNGLQVDLRVVPFESYGAALLYFTGSKAHNIHLRRIAQDLGLKINEYGVYRGSRRIAGRTEEEVYRAIGLPWIAPELREDRGEIELARKGRLPKLVELKDIRGDLHTHTNATDGRATLKEMVRAAKGRGYGYLAITDHSRRVTMANGLDPKRCLAQWKEIDKMNRQANGIRILKGIELDILADGSLDLPDEVLREADWVIASVHYNQRQPRSIMTKRVIEAIRSPYVSAIAHPTGRLLGKRTEIDLDLDEVFKVAAAEGCAIEANGQPSRLDLDDVRLTQAKAMGVKVVIDSDAHSTEQLGNVEYGLAQARRAGLEKSDVLNTRSRVG